MKDWRVIQLTRVERERRQFIEETSLEQVNSSASSKKGYPPGSVFLWALGAVYGPIGSADEQRKGTT